MTEAVLRHFGVTPDDRIGHGGDATVYALSDDRVLRVLHSAQSPIARIASFYDELAVQEPGFALPLVLEHGEIGGVAYSVDRRMPGRPLIDLLPELSGDRRRRALDAYLDAAEAIGSLRIDRPLYGEILADRPLQRARWTDFLLDRADAALARSTGRLATDVAEFDTALAAVRREIAALPPEVERKLVHGDFFPGNVMIDDELTVSGVLDFGTLTVMGDAAMDVASAIMFMEVVPGGEPEDDAYLTARATRTRGPSFADRLHAYRAYYALRLAPYAEADDPRLYAWCVDVLRMMADVRR